MAAQGPKWPEMKVQVSTEGAKCIRITRNVLTEERTTNIIHQNSKLFLILIIHLEPPFLTILPISGPFPARNEGPDVH